MKRRPSRRQQRQFRITIGDETIKFDAIGNRADAEADIRKHRRQANRRHVATERTVGAVGLTGGRHAALLRELNRADPLGRRVP